LKKTIKIFEMAKDIQFNTDARNGLKAGVDKLADAVKVPLVPRDAMWSSRRKFGAPAVTKDGVSVAREIELKDSLENMGAQMVKEVASKTADVAGDGTTTATVLAQALIGEGFAQCCRRREPDGFEARHGQSDQGDCHGVAEDILVKSEATSRKLSKSQPFPPTMTKPSVGSSLKP